MHYQSIEDLVGNTPLVKLKRLPGADAAARNNIILGKMEGNNPAGSVKDRPALSMIKGAEERGEIKPGDTLIEATSGNTGTDWPKVMGLPHTTQRPASPFREVDSAERNPHCGHAVRVPGSAFINPFP